MKAEPAERRPNRSTRRTPTTRTEHAGARWSSPRWPPNSEGEGARRRAPSRSSTTLSSTPGSTPRPTAWPCSCSTWPATCSHGGPTSSPATARSRGGSATRSSSRRRSIARRAARRLGGWAGPRAVRRARRAERRRPRLAASRFAASRRRCWRRIARQLAHYAGHVHQIVLLAKHLRGPAWHVLSIPRGQSPAYTDRLQAAARHRRERGDGGRRGMIAGMDVVHVPRSCGGCGTEAAARGPRGAHPRRSTEHAHRVRERRDGPRRELRRARRRAVPRRRPQVALLAAAGGKRTARSR